MKKIAISQRWEEKFQKEVRETAAKYGTSMTQLTIEALELMIALSSSEKFRKLTEAERKQLIIEASQNVIEADLPEEPRRSQLNMEGLSSIGLIRDRVEKVLVNNPKHQFSTNDLSELLKIPQSTARTYVRDIHEEKPDDFVLVKGRPNKIYYIG